MDTRSNESITSKKEYIYKVTYYKQVADEHYSAKDEIEAEKMAWDVFEDNGHELENGDYFEVEKGECDECGEHATKELESLYCDECYEELMFSYGYGEEIKNEQISAS